MNKKKIIVWTLASVRSRRLSKARLLLCTPFHQHK